MSERSRLQEELRQGPPFHSVYQEAALGLLRTADVLHRCFEALYEPYGITAQQYNVLRILRGARPKPLPTMEIAERMIERAPGITRLVDRLADKGLVSRERCPTDRRQVLCEITASGLELLEDLDEPVARADDEMLSMLSEDEARTLVSLLDRVREPG